jgi:hypothetical protein
LSFTASRKLGKSCLKRNIAALVGERRER